MSLSAWPTEITADGTSVSQIQATVLDQSGNLMPDGTEVIFSTDLGTLGGGTTIRATTLGGVAEAVLTASTLIGQATVTATAGTVSKQVIVRLKPGPPDALILAASSESLTVGEQAIVTITVRDRYGNPVADGTTIDLETTLGTLHSTSLGTGGGSASTALRSTVAGWATVTARSGARSRTVQIHFRPLVQISKQVDRSSAPAGGLLTYSILIRNDSDGGEHAELTELRDALPAGFVYLPGSATPGALGGDPAIQDHVLTWTPSPSPHSLAPQTAITIAFQVAAEAREGTYHNVALVDGANFAAASTGPTAQVTLDPPTLLSIAPRTGCNHVQVPVRIAGTRFAPGLTARLGSWALVVTASSEDTVDAIVPAGIPAGDYSLEVIHPGGANATLPGAYSATDCVPPDATLSSGYLGTYGAEPLTAPAGGDPDQVQVLFLEMPDTTTEAYLRLYDPDCGGDLDTQNGLAWDSPFTFTVYGGPGAYTDPGAASVDPGTGASPGTVRTRVVFGEDATTDKDWYTIPLVVNEGEHVGSRRVFKLTVVGGPKPPFEAGIGYADLNLYDVALSTSSTSNSALPGARILAFSWTFLIPEGTYSTPPLMFPFVAPGVTSVRQHNWDYDNDAFGDGRAGITVTTPIRTFSSPDSAVSGDAEERWSDYAVSEGERNITWAISCWAAPTGTTPPQRIGDNLVTFWVTDQNGNALPIFARSTIDPPP